MHNYRYWFVNRNKCRDAIFLLKPAYLMEFFTKRHWGPFAEVTGKPLPASTGISQFAWIWTSLSLMIAFSISVKAAGPVPGRIRQSKSMCGRRGMTLSWSEPCIIVGAQVLRIIAFVVPFALRASARTGLNWTIDVKKKRKAANGPCENSAQTKYLGKNAETMQNSEIWRSNRQTCP